MNAANMMPSKPATTFSARRRIQPTTSYDAHDGLLPSSARAGGPGDRRACRGLLRGRAGPARGTPRYLTAVILSSIPGAQLFASSEARYTFCA